MFGHTKTLQALLGMGSTALAAAVALPRYVCVYIMGACGRSESRFSEKLQSGLQNLEDKTSVTDSTMKSGIGTSLLASFENLEEKKKIFRTRFST